METTESFDYIVVGGGTAGCVLAARLSEDPGLSVLLLEAGPLDPVPDMADPRRWWQLVGSAVDWDYETVPQPGLGDGVLRVPQGKVLGGSSGINGVMFIRGDRFGFDAWDAAGAAGWTYDSLLPYFKRSERAPGRDPAQRGMNGPVFVEQPGATARLWEACFEAAVEVGHRFNEDCNSGSGEGVSFHDNNIRDGRRVSAADAYLTAATGRPNLTVRGDAHVQRLLLEGTVCRGVIYRVGHRTTQTVADREVIVTAGAIPSPALLLRSGIGPADHLRSVGVDVVVDLPGVGENFHDHVKSQVTYTARTPVSVSDWARKPHVLLRSAPTARPDLHLLFTDFPVRPRWQPQVCSGYSVVFGLMTPASRGHVRLASADPDRQPLVHPNLLGDPGDLDQMLRGLDAAREVGSASALAGLRDREVYPGPDVVTDAERRHYIRSTATSYTHLVGTCRIGTGALAVVDPELRVRGVDNLRIADASVMPSVPSANTNPAVFAIAERAVDLVRDGQ
ncbi:GMC family oxidoreductase [Streptomyces sp. NPDC008238]